jgi:hypothetical protein
MMDVADFYHSADGEEEMVGGEIEGCVRLV